MLRWSEQVSGLGNLVVRPRCHTCWYCNNMESDQLISLFLNNELFVSVLGLRPVYISLLLSQPPGSSSSSQACSPETAELASVIRANKHHTFAISTRPANSFQTGPHFTAAWTRCGTKWRPRAWLGVCKRNNVCSPEDLDGYMGHCWLTLAYHRTISTELCASINTF